jgi:hypothetical protein
MDAASCIRFTHLLAGGSNPIPPEGKSSHDSEKLPRLLPLLSGHFTTNHDLKYLLTDGDNSPHSRPLKLVLFHLPLSCFARIRLRSSLDLDSQASIPLLQPKRHQHYKTRAQPGFIIMLPVCGNCYTADLSRPSEVHGIQLQY